MEENHTVPKGCILVVKAHSGDTTKSGEYEDNIISLLDPKNREIVFDPVSHKAELFNIFIADLQVTAFYNICSDIMPYKNLFPCNNT